MTEESVAVDIKMLAEQMTTLTSAGSTRFVGRCPFHDEQTPSFHIDTRQQVFCCFGCGASGDALELALRWAARSAVDGVQR